MNYGEIIEFVERKYKIDTRDYAKKFETHIKLTEQYNQTVPEQLRIRGNTQFTSDAYNQFERWLEKNNLPSLQNEDIPYLDYWHWLIDHDFEGIHNGERRYWELQRIIGDNETPTWVKEITQKIHDEFREKLDECGGLEVKISW